jgi:hypothetical protein
MVPGWFPFKFVSDNPALHSRWLLLLKIEISSIVHLTQLHCGGHLGGRAQLPDTILEEDHPMTIPSKFGFN